MDRRIDNARRGALIGQSDPLRLSVLISLLIALCALVGATFVPTYWPLWLSSRQVYLQDGWLLLALCGVSVIAFLAGRMCRPTPVGNLVPVTILAFLLIAVCYAGHYLVLCGYDLTRDEQMVTFDAWIFRHGALVWPLPGPWRSDADALNLMFMYPVHRPVAWVSGYLPGNAWLHAVIGTVADPALTTPLLTGLSLPVLWSTARKIWPDDREACAIVALLFITSGQVVLSGMTTYAMPAHLFCNLCWLRLFMSNRKSFDCIALVLGWFATGLHQPLFHPLFVAPFLFLLAVERNWLRLLWFLFGYGAIGLFWISWPGQMMALVSDSMSAVSSTGGDFASRLFDTLASNRAHLPLFGANMLRFITWENALLLPLLIAAGPAIIRNRLAAALATGLILSIVVFAILLPWQGNGFGYRYLHPVLGNAFLLAGYGWREVIVIHPNLRPAFRTGVAGTLAIMVPLWLGLSQARYAPFAKAADDIDASGATYLVLDRAQGLSYGSLVLNRPDLSNRPIRLAADAIHDPVSLARRICREGAIVAFAANSFFRPGARYFGAQPLNTADARLAALSGPYAAAGCRIKLIR